MPSKSMPATSISAIVNTVLQGIAICLTLFRLALRISIRRFWWDDVWAGIAIICGLLCVIFSWVYVRTSGTLAIIGYWTYTYAFNCVVWAVRMSILYSITRLIHPSRTSHRITLAVSTIFGLLWAGLLIWKTYICGHDLYWYNLPTIACPFTHASDIYQLISDIVSDTILVGLSWRILWNIKLPEKRQRRMILLIFSSSILVSFVSLFRAICRILNQDFIAFVIGQVEVTVCLFVCSLLVTVTYLDRLLTRNDEPASESDNSSDPDSLPQPGTTMLCLTTVDLDLSSGETVSSKHPRSSLSGEIHSTPGGLLSQA
ncbi:hypothetical protein BJ138DRAFT_1144497 [Hygrophoropsis aurantiaca]|uniref:Uncharacterized protein n=1 Tax=Hygrophoropsis aurantiaca TaxID=72124 RepID=A0ACB8AKT7_9AGAM|nr:hypothetical protein BJ138DRAFT_1144497 [Hygrophoropsis aurantiaca]